MMSQLVILKMVISGKPVKFLLVCKNLSGKANLKTVLDILESSKIHLFPFTFWHHQHLTVAEKITYPNNQTRLIKVILESFFLKNTRCL